MRWLRRTDATRTSLRAAVLVAASLCWCLAAQASAAPTPSAPTPRPSTPVPADDAPSAGWPTSLPDLINRVIPPAPIPHAAAVPDPLSGAPGTTADLTALRRAVMPSPVGDPFFDAWPPDLARYPDGAVIETRDVTPVAAPLLVVAMQRVTQLKFRTTDAHGAPSFATATLALPATPWSGPGTRPVVVNDLPIDALGRNCTPSYTLAHGFSQSTSLTDFVPPLSHLAALRGYAVLIPDYEGPRMAYAEPFVAGHAVLDAVRAMRAWLPDELGHSRVALAGYSGGAIATVAAAELIDGYAPDLAGVVVGAAAGGVPADFEMLTHSMNGNVASAVFMAAVFGIGRERPEILGQMNHLAQWIATSPMKDQCIGVFAMPGVLMLPIDVAANVPDALGSPVAHEVLAATRMSGVKAGTPLFIYNGEQEFWVPAAGARGLFAAQCGMGADAEYLSVPGEHVIAGGLGFVPAVTWLDQRLSGVPARSGC